MLREATVVVALDSGGLAKVFKSNGVCKTAKLLTTWL